MADFADGMAVVRVLAESDWKGISTKEVADELGWEYQKASRALLDLETGCCAYRQTNSIWRLDTSFINLLVSIQSTYVERLNALGAKHSPQKALTVTIDGSFISQETAAFLLKDFMSDQIDAIKANDKEEDQEGEGE